MMRHSIGHHGRKISYLEAGDANAEPGRTLVLLHAFPLAAEMWESQLRALPPGWRVIAPDLRGFGESAPADPAHPPSIDDYSEDVSALLDALAVERTVLAGLSMGGYAAFSFVRLQPQRVSGLVLADTRAEADSETARAGRDAMLEVLSNEGPIGVFERMLPGLLGQTTRRTKRATVEAVRALALSQPPNGIADGLRRLKSRPDSRPMLAAIAIPTLVVVGEEDQITTPDVARQLHEGIPGSRLAVIPKAGHLSNLEQPEAFNRALAEFLGLF